MKKLLFILFPVLLFSSCRTELETVTVRSHPSTIFSPQDGLAKQAEKSGDDEFIHIRIGEIASIESLDPLFATSNSEFRVLNLIYERLVKIDENGNPVPGLAKNWDINHDSTRFTFHLKTNVYFHSSQNFENANSRQVTARDVRFVFERMASAKVPGFAASHFMDIKGFSGYYNERIHVKNPTKRALKSISGIEVSNDSTLTFVLNKSGRDFLQRLAHPQASIYARESVLADGSPIQRALGTGSFRFIQKEGNRHLLTTHNPQKSNIANINRLDIISGLNERDLYQQFARNNLDVLIEIGPSSMKTIADSSGQLLSQFYQNYSLSRASAEAAYPIYFNSQSSQDKQAYEFISRINRNSLKEKILHGTISYHLPDTTLAPEKGSGQLVINHTKHPHHLFLIRNLAEQAAENGFNFVLSPSYAIWEEITFSNYPYSGTREFLVWKYPIFILNHDHITGIRIHHEPWNLNLTSLKTSLRN